MAEAVVVTLEAVEVEEHQQRRSGMLLVQPPLEVEDELAAVEETRERVGDRLMAGQLVEPRVLPEGRDEAEDDEKQRRSREDNSQQVHVSEVVVDEDSDG